MKIRAQGFDQAGTDLVVGVITGAQLLDRLESKLWEPDIFSSRNPEGYQRTLSEARAREFGRFVLQHGVCPLSILVNFREGKVTVAEDGTCEIPDGPAYIVDGQHRAKGIEFAYLQDPAVAQYEIPIVVMNEPDRHEEARQFVIINRSAKGVKADLAERFLLQAVNKEGRKSLLEQQQSGVLRSVLRGAEWKTKALEIADILNADRSSTWHNAIRLPNEPKAGSVVAQKSFTDSLEPVLRDSYFVGKDPKSIATALRNYWGALRDNCEAAFDTEERQGYVIQKTIGVYVFHKIFPRISEMCTDDRGNRVLTQARLRDLLYGIPQMDSTFWASGGEAGRRGTGSKAVSLLTMEILESLESKVVGTPQEMIV